MWFTPVTNQLNGGMIFQVGTPWNIFVGLNWQAAKGPDAASTASLPPIGKEKEAWESSHEQDGTVANNIDYFIDLSASIMSPYYVVCHD